MSRTTIKTLSLVALIACIVCSSCDRQKESSSIPEGFSVRISDKPMTFCNPLPIYVGNERARRAGEPVVLIYKDDYYLFLTGSRGYWFSGNFRDWTYVDAPNSRVVWYL